jgi:hypothetical protein
VRQAECNFRGRRQRHGIEIKALRAERLQPFRRGLADPAHADISDRLAEQLPRARSERVDMPAPVPQFGIGKRQQLADRQHQQDRVLGNADRRAFRRECER